jgi:CRISPR-associated protein Csm3
MATLAFRGHVKITGSLELLTGLHIGAGKDQIEIGGIDNPVVRHPHTREPYIPGSSIKGKLRFMLEWAFGSLDKDGDVWGADKAATYDSRDPILRIFGTALEKKKWSQGPTRLVVRDALLNSEWLMDAKCRGWERIEEKQEVAIDRIAGKAMDGRLRTTERVPSGAKFNMEIVFRLYETDGDDGARDKQCLNWLLAGLSLLEQDALGGSGSRGYGRVRFDDLKVAFDGREEAIGERFRVNRFDPNEAPTIVSL